MVETLLEAYLGGWKIRARCLGTHKHTPKSTVDCGRGIELDIATLMWTRGGPFPLAALQGRLRCPWCGSYRLILSFDPPATAGELSRRIQQRRVT